MSRSRNTFRRRRFLSRQTRGAEYLEHRLLLSATQIADINQLGFSFPEGQPFLDQFLLVAERDDIGRELWLSDGTVEGTELLKDINQGSSSSSPRLLGELNGEFLFTATVGADDQLWKTDGTSDGTVLVVDYTTGDVTNSNQTSDPVLLGGSIYFAANDGVNGVELWKTNGTAGGTMLVADINTVSGSSFPGQLTEFNGELFFNANDGDGYKLWKSDGSASGTEIVLDQLAGDLTNADGTLFFFASDAEHGRELWKSDGTTAGSMMVKDVRPGAESSVGNSLFGAVDGIEGSVGGTIYFGADDGVHGTEFWKSDGTESGTVLVADIEPGADSSQPYEFFNLGGVSYFQLYDGTEEGKLWRTDGTPEGTESVHHLIPVGSNEYVNSVVVANDRLLASVVKHDDDFFILQESLWATDGTASGSSEIAVFDPQDESVLYLLPAGDEAFFEAVNGTSAAIWRTDGTANGTNLIGSLNNPSSHPSEFVNFDDAFFFTADNGLGTELWKTDGTPQNTALFHKVGQDNFTDGNVGWLTPSNGKLFFTGSTTGANANELWVSDGTTENTMLLRTFAANTQVTDLFDGGTYLLFVADDGVNGEALWTSDGTIQGTVLVKDVNPNDDDGISLNTTTGTQSFLTVFDSASNAATLWVTDGTENGTLALTTASNGGIFEVASYDGFAYFSADDGAAGNELWRTDGTIEGTAIFADLNPGATGSFPEWFEVLNGNLYFAADDGTNGSELWVSDGTRQGTTLLKDINPASGEGADIREPFAMGNSLYFYADDGQNGQELWMSDGTDVGTVLVKDINPGAAGSLPVFGEPDFFDAGGELIFTATDGSSTSGEFWRSDGSASGTQPVVAPDGGLNVLNFPVAFLNDALLVAANDGTTGIELWSVPLSGLSGDEGNVDGDSDFDANDAFLIQLVALSGTDAQIDQSKGGSPLSATEIRAQIQELTSTADIDGDNDFDANDAFLIQLVKLSATDAQIDQSKGASSLSAAEIRSGVESLGSSFASTTSESRLVAIVADDPDSGERDRLFTGSDQSAADRLSSPSRDVSATPVDSIVSEFRDWIDAL